MNIKHGTGIVSFVVSVFLECHVGSELKIFHKKEYIRV